METINKLIYNALISKAGIFLPKIGTLSVVNVASKKLRGGKIIAPYMSVNFSAKQLKGKANIINLLTKQGVSDGEQLYKKWLEQALKTKGSCIIAGVGQIKNNAFKPSPELEKVLGTPKTIAAPKSKKSGAALYIVFAVLVVVALGLFISILPQQNTKPAPAPAPKVEPVIEPKPVVEAVKVVEAEPEVEVVSTPKNFHVIVGSYLIRSNALKFIKDKPGYELLEMDDPRILVSAGAFETLTQAWNAMKTMQQDDPEVWVHQVK